MVPVLNPIVIATLGCLVVCLFATVAISLIIKRREAARNAGQQLEPARIQIQRIQRATSAEMPTDLQKRLRMLTADLDKSLADAAGTAPPPRSGSTARAAAPPAPSSPRDSTPVLPDDKTSFFGDESRDGPLGADVTSRFEDGTARFFDVDTRPGDDATHAFNPDDAAIDPREFFGEDIVPVGGASPQGEDATAFFGEHESMALPEPSQTKFFTPAELGDGTAYPAHAVDGTAMLQALPPGIAPGHPQELDVEPLDVIGPTGPLQALPRSQTRVDAATLDRVRVCLTMPHAPEVVALCVLDGTGQVLTGEDDDGLAGELRALLDEADMGSQADVDQPVRLGDDEQGALLLLPTGANALLGALVLESGDPVATRAGLRRLARQIGDAMRRAS